MGRVYKIGKQLILVPQRAIEKLIEWNETPKRNDVNYDRKVCFSWLLSLTSKEQIVAFNISCDVMDFIKGSILYLIRILFMTLIFLLTM